MSSPSLCIEYNTKAACPVKLNKTTLSITTYWSKSEVTHSFGSTHLALALKSLGNKIYVKIKQKIPALSASLVFVGCYKGTLFDMYIFYIVRLMLVLV